MSDTYEFQKPAVHSVFTSSSVDRTTVFYIDGVEQVRIAPDGFFVKGVKVNDDPEKLYEGMTRWVTNALARTKPEPDFETCERCGKSGTWVGCESCGR